MAVVKYSGLISELKGSVGGVTFQRCGQSLSARSNPSHRKARTVPCMGSRLQFSAIANYWRGLSITDKNAFDLVASSYPFTDKYGVSFVPTGYQLFVSLNRMLVMCGYPIINNPLAYAPPVFTQPHISSFDLTGFVMEFDFPADLPASSIFVIFVSNPTFSATPFASVPYYYAFYQAGLTAGVTDLGVQVYNSLKIAPREGQVITIKTFLLMTATCQSLLLNEDNYPVIRT